MRDTQWANIIVLIVTITAIIVMVLGVTWRTFSSDLVQTNRKLIKCASKLQCGKHEVIYTRTIWSTKFFPEENPVQFCPFNLSKLIERLSFRDQMLSILWNDFVLHFPSNFYLSLTSFMGVNQQLFLQPLYFKWLFVFEAEYASSKVLGLQYVCEFSLWMKRSSCSRLDINWSLFWGCLQGRRFWWGLWVWPGLNLITLQLPKEGR